MKIKALTGLFMILLLLLHHPAQATDSKYATVDSIARSTGFYSLEELTRRLTGRYDDNTLKVRSIFRWITEHISYDVQEMLHPSYVAPVFQYTSTEDSITKQKLCALNYTNNVLKKRKGICEGYASLFKTMCELAGIKSEIIHGTAKAGLEEIGKSQNENHAWNAVFLEGKWQLLDACWASGYCRNRQTFVKQYSEYYYLTDPGLLMYNHYPSDAQWQLVEQPVTYNQFISLPCIMFDKPNRKIQSFSPLTGELELSQQDSVTFTINLGDAEIKEVMRTSRVIEYDADGNFVKRPREGVKPNAFYQDGKLIRYVYYPWNPQVASLYLEHKGEYMVAYRLKSN